jgi:hypothetical protein
MTSFSGVRHLTIMSMNSATTPKARHTGFTTLNAGTVGTGAARTSTSTGSH